MRAFAAALLAASLLAGPMPARGGPPPGKEEYVYVEATRRLVGRLHAGYIDLGFLDGAGTFSADRQYSPIKQGQPRSGPGFTLINGDPGTAYEYRSGRLILGAIDQQGNFVPALGSKVIAFEDYKPGGNAPPIWNLPGWFVKKGEEMELRKQLEKELEKQKNSAKLEELEKKELERQIKELEKMELERLKKEQERQKHKDKP